jgi:hypothetical protein
MKTKLPSRENRKKQAKRAALRALKKARRQAEASGAKLSNWEDEFLVSVEARVEKFGRAFGDPEKGGMDSSLSVRQAVKVKEIAAKAKPRSLTRRSVLRRIP